MAQVRLTEQAQNELDAIIAYYEQVGAVDFAEVLEDNLIARLRRPERFPRKGRIVPEIGDEAIREVIYRNYRIVYVVDQDEEEVDVLTIFHASKQFGTLGSTEE